MYNHKDGVILRKIEKKDLPSLLEIKNESWWGTHKISIINLDDQDFWYNNTPNDQLYMVGQTEGQNEIVGVCSYTNIDWQNRTLSISGSVAKKYRSRFAKAGFCAGLDFAFEVLNMNRLEAEVLEYHIPAQKIEIELLGFKIEGVKRKNVYKSGKYYNSFILGLLREEWQESHRVKQYGDTCNLNFSHNICEKLIKKYNISI